MSNAQVCSGGGTAPKGCGRFFIVRTIWNEGAGFEDEFDYLFLHADGKWRDSLLNESNEPTGWHASREAAQRLLAQSELQGVE